jgi:hypothetical protein
MQVDFDTLLRSSEVWVQFTGVIVHDPDGWDRKNFEASWLEPITLAEFKRRVYMSTVNFKSVTDFGW